MADRVRVVVGANAAVGARRFAALAGQLGAAARSLAASSKALADQSGWRGGAAARFRQDRQRMTALLDRLVPAMERMAKGAQSVVDDIDRADASGAAKMPAAPNVTTASAGAAGAGGSTPAVELAAYTTDTGHGRFWPEDTVLNQDGAFQPSINGKDYNSIPRTPAIVDYYNTTAQEAHAYLYLMGGPNAGQFFSHYLQGSGQDLNFDSTVPYYDSANFASMVDKTAAEQIAAAEATGTSAFDSGWIYDAIPGGRSGTPQSPFTDSADWNLAVGKGYYRLVGHRTPEGTWQTTLQMTSYYDFHESQNFGHGVTGHDMHALHQAGIAQDFREIGSGSLFFDSTGGHILPVAPGPSPTPVAPSPPSNPPSSPDPTPGPSPTPSGGR